MTLTNSSRKRQCSNESEYLPVTKRMNNLHIDVSCNQFNESSINGQQMAGLEIPIEAMHQNYGFRCQQNQSLNGINGLNHSSNSALNSCHLRKTYSPELDSNQNPIYYESNRILYEAHQQRILRSAVSARDYIFNKKH